MYFVPVSHRPHLARQLDRLLADAALTDATRSRTPALDVAESEQAYTVQLDLPGVTRDEVQVSVEGRRVSIEVPARAADEQKAGERIVHRERAATRVARQFALPQEVDSSATVARLELGVLTLTLPKRLARTASKIAVN